MVGIKKLQRISFYVSPGTLSFDSIPAGLQNVLDAGPYNACHPELTLNRKRNKI